MTTRLHIAKFEDHDGFGRCGHCGREGLRWIAILSDGTSCGTECAKRVLGVAPRTSKLAWLTGAETVAEHSDKWETAVVYRYANGRTTLAVNGVPQVVGAGMAEFQRRYGVAA